MVPTGVGQALVLTSEFNTVRVAALAGFTSRVLAGVWEHPIIIQSNGELSFRVSIPEVAVCVRFTKGLISLLQGAHAPLFVAANATDSATISTLCTLLSRVVELLELVSIMSVDTRRIRILESLLSVHALHTIVASELLSKPMCDIVTTRSGMDACRAFVAAILAQVRESPEGLGNVSEQLYTRCPSLHNAFDKDKEEVCMDHDSFKSQQTIKD